MSRDEETLQPSVYLNKLPAAFPPGARVLVTDPIIATGAAACAICCALGAVASRTAFMLVCRCRRRLPVHVLGCAAGARRRDQCHSRGGRRCRATRAQAPVRVISGCVLRLTHASAPSEACEPTGLRVFVAMIDEVLDERGRIVPGLGDAGDRAFGTLA